MNSVSVPPIKQHQQWLVLHLLLVEVVIKSGSVVEGEQEPEELGGQDGEQYANIQV